MIVLGALVLSVGVVYSFYRPSEAEKEELIIQLVTSGLQQAHFAPQAFDNSFSGRMFDFYLESLDPGKRFFLASDVEGWTAYRNDLDNAVLTSDYTFFDSTYETLMMRIGQTKSHYQEILAEPFDFTVEEYIETDPSKLAYATNLEEQKEYWRQYLKYRTMLRVDDLLERQGDSLSLKEIEVKARKKVLKSHDDWYDRMDEMERKDWHAVYINSITAVFDPHTQYFPPYDQDAFEIQMSGQLEAFGTNVHQTDQRLVSSGKRGALRGLSTSQAEQTLPGPFVNSAQARP